MYNTGLKNIGIEVALPINMFGSGRLRVKTQKIRLLRNNSAKPFIPINYLCGIFTVLRGLFTFVTPFKLIRNDESTINIF
jgi:hypothetical protein